MSYNSSNIVYYLPGDYRNLKWFFYLWSTQQALPCVNPDLVGDALLRRFFRERVGEPQMCQVWLGFLEVKSKNDMNS